MSENIENLMLEQLRAIRAGQDRIEFEVKEVKTRISHLENVVLGNRRDSVGAQEDIYRQQTTIDKMADRIDRIEKLLQNVSA
ncbi:hypothetical protein [Propionivibrio sp.]|uniref:hypothetical protein n=1 Tax=Propionivibrio sp. TaxID=2212460 RepID=UPI002626BC78|nr:hypothetical protein [Propionivibrio sp.]